MSLTSAGLATVMTQRLAASADATEQAGLFAHHLRLSIAWAALLALAVLVFGERGGASSFRRRTRPGGSCALGALGSACGRRSRYALPLSTAAIRHARRRWHWQHAVCCREPAWGLPSMSLAPTHRRPPGGCSSATRWRAGVAAFLVRRALPGLRLAQYGWRARTRHCPRWHCDAIRCCGVPCRSLCRPSQLLRQQHDFARSPTAFASSRNTLPWSRCISCWSTCRLSSDRPCCP